MKPGPKGTHKPRKYRPAKNRQKHRASMNDTARAYNAWVHFKDGSMQPKVPAFKFPEPYKGSLKGWTQ